MLDGASAVLWLRWPCLPLPAGRPVDCDPEEAPAPVLAATASPQQAICPQCREPFAPRRRDQIYCSRACRMAHHNAKREPKAGNGGSRHTGETVIPLSAEPLPDRIERPFRSEDRREPRWVAAELQPPALPWRPRAVCSKTEFYSNHAGYEPVTKFCCGAGAGGGSRTHKALSGRGILSPLRLPVPPRPRILSPTRLPVPPRPLMLDSTNAQAATCPLGRARAGLAA